MTFVDYAEMVWRKAEAGATQQAIADELGWSRSQVSQYAMLGAIDKAAWRIVATTLESASLLPDDEAVASSATTVAFSERLLREITALTSAQQIELVTELAQGKIAKNKLKALAEAYKARNDAEAFVRAQLGEIDAEMIGLQRFVETDGVAGCRTIQALRIRNLRFFYPISLNRDRANDCGYKGRCSDPRSL